MQVILGTFLIIFFFTTMLVLSTLKVEIKNFEIDNKNKVKDYNLDINLYLYKLRYIKIKLRSNQKKKFKGKILKILLGKKTKTNKNSLKNILEIIKIYKIENIDLRVKFGSENVILTSYITAIISSIIGIILANQIKKNNKEKVKFKIMPYYINENFFNIKLNCIIFTRIVHIIHIIIKQIKRRDEVNGRTSNRKFNDNSYGQY